MKNVTGGPEFYRAARFIPRSFSFGPDKGFLSRSEDHVGRKMNKGFRAGVSCSARSAAGNERRPPAAASCRASLVVMRLQPEMKQQNPAAS